MKIFLIVLIVVIIVAIIWYVCQRDKGDSDDELIIELVDGIMSVCPSTESVLSGVTDVDSLQKVLKNQGKRDALISDIQLCIHQELSNIGQALIAAINKYCPELMNVFAGAQIMTVKDFIDFVKEHKDKISQIIIDCRNKGPYKPPPVITTDPNDIVAKFAEGIMSVCPSTIYSLKDVNSVASLKALLHNPTHRAVLKSSIEECLGMTFKDAIVAYRAAIVNYCPELINIFADAKIMTVKDFIDFITSHKKQISQTIMNCQDDFIAEFVKIIISFCPDTQFYFKNVNSVKSLKKVLHKSYHNIKIDINNCGYKYMGMSLKDAVATYCPELNTIFANTRYMTIEKFIDLLIMNKERILQGIINCRDNKFITDLVYKITILCPDTQFYLKNVNSVNTLEAVLSIESTRTALKNAIEGCIGMSLKDVTETYCPELKNIFVDAKNMTIKEFIDFLIKNKERISQTIIDCYRGPYIPPSYI